MAKAKSANSFGNKLGGSLQSVGGMMAGGMFGGGGGGGGIGGMIGSLFGGTGSPATVAGPANQTMHRFTGSGGTAYGTRPSTLPPGW